MPHDPDRLRVIRLADNHDLIPIQVMRARNILRPRYDRTGAVNNLNAELFGLLIGFRRLAMRPDEDLLRMIAMIREHRMARGRQSQIFEPRDFHFIVNHVAETEQRQTCGLQLLFGHLHDATHPATETRARINQHLHSTSGFFFRSFAAERAVSVVLRSAFIKS